ncbi:hypothetical protein LRY65_01405 [Candidatus Woesebacteria bacterium]|nr:hypothetical protein [Candidatus Woesebacteria bacterium]MCD8526849.1 hypothetical protein [Candidatus Woesebacteria bacterium]MCD8545811.1 hypothetical protein [Candidatus Woesebacteria bacterium]
MSFIDAEMQAYLVQQIAKCKKTAEEAGRQVYFADNAAEINEDILTPQQILQALRDDNLNLLEIMALITETMETLEIQEAATVR